MTVNSHCNYFHLLVIVSNSILPIYTVEFDDLKYSIVALGLPQLCPATLCKPGPIL